MRPQPHLAGELIIHLSSRRGTSQQKRNLDIPRDLTTKEESDPEEPRPSRGTSDPKNLVPAKEALAYQRDLSFKMLHSTSVYLTTFVTG